jgi:hypothetical protein
VLSLIAHSHLGPLPPPHVVAVATVRAPMNLAAAAALFLTAHESKNSNNRNFYYRRLINARRYFGKFNEAR